MQKTEERPWGTWTIVHQGNEGVVKTLVVNPGCMLSLQVHDDRDEYWTPLSTGLLAYTRNAAGTSSGRLLRFNEPYTVPRGTVHRLINPTENAITVIEVIKGFYREQDITRLHDSYGRE